MRPGLILVSGSVAGDVELGVRAEQAGFDGAYTIEIFNRHGFVPLGALAALGGAYPSATLPILAAAAAAFVASGATVGRGDARTLDAALVALAAAVAVQLVPLPPVVAAFASPHLAALRAVLYLDSGVGSATLSADPSRTRAALASLASALFVFWAAREIFSAGGVRAAARAVALAGFALTVVALIQRATAPELLLWTWTPADPGSQPFGPFVNRNHLATWLLMAASLTAGYLVAHARSHASPAPALRLRVRDWLADGTGLMLAGALLWMLVGIAATLSRAAILGAGAALAAGALLSRREEPSRAARIAAACLAVLLALGVWSNRDGLARKFDAATTASRLAIWRESMPVVRDFWLTGTGAGTYGPAMLHYQRRMREVHLNQAHSEYVQTAAEGGVLLIVPLAVAIFAALRLARLRLAEDGRPLSWLRIGAAAGLAGAAVQGLFETGLRVPANGLLAALLAAVVLHSRQDRCDPSQRGTPAHTRCT